MATTRWKLPEPIMMPWKTTEFLPSYIKHFTTKKRIRFSHATTYIFDLDHGGSAVPPHQGPPIGLAKTHTRQEHTDLTCAQDTHGRVRRFDHVERMILLQKKANYSRREVATFCFDVIDIRKSRLQNAQEDEEDSEEDQEYHNKRRRIQ